MAPSRAQRALPQRRPDTLAGSVSNVVPVLPARSGSMR
jgi:hypothetical protein